MQNMKAFAEYAYTCVLQNKENFLNVGTPAVVGFSCYLHGAVTFTTQFCLVLFSYTAKLRRKLGVSYPCGKSISLIITHTILLTMYVKSKENP